MDEGTRFQLASVISRGGKIEDGRRAFRMAKQIGKMKPKFVITDGLGVYRYLTKNSGSLIGAVSI